MDDKYSIVTAPPPREAMRENSLVHVAIKTTLGAYYTFPDMTPEMVDELLLQFDTQSEQVVARNISGGTLVLPMRIVHQVLTLSIDEGAMIHASSPQGGMQVLWDNAEAR